MNLNIYNPYVREELYLMHHGILGQRWGKKNGPPYPLSAGAHSASEKKAGWRKSLADKREAKGYQKKLNKLDKTIAVNVGKRDEAYKRGSETIDELNKAYEERNIFKQHEQYYREEQLNKQIDEYEKNIANAKAKTKAVLKEMSSKGYGFEAVRKDHAANNRGAKIAGSALLAIGTAQVIVGGIGLKNPVFGIQGVMTTTAGAALRSTQNEVSGNKYKVKKGIGKGTVHKHEGLYTVTDENDEFRQRRKNVYLKTKAENEWVNKDPKAKSLRNSMDRAYEKYDDLIHNPSNMDDKTRMKKINEAEMQWSKATDAYYDYQKKRNKSF